MDNRPTHKEAFKAAKVLAAYCHDCNTQKCIFYDGFNGEEDTFCRNGSMVGLVVKTTTHKGVAE